LIRSGGRKVCLEFGLRSIRSRPVYVEGKSRGTFVLAYKIAQPEAEWDVALMSFAADAATQALSKDPASGAPLAQSGSRSHQAAEVLIPQKACV
jgi:hypothetical protein